MREKGKAKKISGYKEVITYGFHPYKIPVTDARGITKEVEFVATLKETVPDHTPCDMCGSYLGDLEIDMAGTMISCNHGECDEEKINDLVMKFNCKDCGREWKGKPEEPYWTPFRTQEYICFECFEDMLLI